MQEEISFGTWLRKQRRAWDLTRQAFADQVGCAEVTLRRIEAGTLKPSKELATILLEKLGIPETERTQWISFARGLSSFPTKSIPSSNQSKSNLPASLTTFVGREKEQADVIQLLAKHRLVTLTGSGGVGKTRLAVTVGEQVLANYADGVWLVELTSLNDPLLLPWMVATLLGLVTPSDIPPLDLLDSFLRSKSTLLIFDNCEHLLDACAHLADTLLKNCPNLKILATSREPVEITGEALYRVPSLGLPGREYQLDALREVESVKLFEERAQLVQFDFSLSLDNMVSVAQICQHLDGIPLAIELAAAKVATFSIQEIAKQLRESFNLLAQGSRTALPRHQTLRASIEWSWNLLPEPERRLMRHLSVFVGGWTLEAAQSVSDGSVVFLLNSLVNKSLIGIHQRNASNSRYFFHETIRQYAREKLLESDEGNAVRGWHLDFFLSVALRFEQEAHGTQLLNGIISVNSEHDNLLEAMNWAGISGQAQLGLQLGSALHYYWLCRGYWSIGRDSLERLLSFPEAGEHTTARAEALNLAGDLAIQQGDLEAARILLEESKITGLKLGQAGKRCLGWTHMLLGESWVGPDKTAAQFELEQSIILLREADTPWRLAIALHVRGWLAGSQGNLEQARDFFSESFDILRTVGDTWTSADPTASLGWVFYCLGEYDKAAAYLQQALAIYRAVEDKFSTPGVFADLGCVVLLQGHIEQAIRYFEESLSIARELRAKRRIASTLCNLGIALGRCGDYAQATVLLKEALQLSQEIRNLYVIAACLTGLAGIQQQPLRAAQALAAAQAIFERSKEFIEPLYSIEQERVENKLRERLNAQDFAKFSEEGQAMTVDQAITLALQAVEEM
jgi:predicted ATPase/Tfp pilus assembly protein PilF/DNA-binding XRE family transcriptional regulator